MSLHSKLLQKWNACEFGVKQRVFKDDMPQTTVQYILKTPTYKDTKKMKQIIDKIDFHAKKVNEETQKMYNKIKEV